MISIIVPVYNVEVYLPQCLDSLVNQTYKDIEIICVNDGSTDGSLTILESYAKKDKRIQVMSHENRGLSESRNDALEKAKGEYIMFVDSDDWIELNTCQRAIDTMHEYDSDLIMWSYLREFPSKSLSNLLYDSIKIWDNTSQFTRRLIGPIKDELQNPEKLDSYGTIWGKLYKRIYIEKKAPIRFVDVKKIGTCEDVIYNIEYSVRINRVVYIPELLYHYRKYGSSYTLRYRANLPQLWNNQYQMIETIGCRYDFKFYKEAYYNRISLGILGLGLNVTFSSEPFIKQYQAIRDILVSDRYREAVQYLSIGYMPVHWKAFYIFAKRKNTFALLLMLKWINLIIKR